MMLSSKYFCHLDNDKSILFDIELPEGRAPCAALGKVTDNAMPCSMVLVLVSECSEYSNIFCQKSDIWIQISKSLVTNIFTYSDYKKVRVRIYSNIHKILMNTFEYQNIVRPLTPSPMTRVSPYSHTSTLSSLFSLSLLKLTIYSKANISQPNINILI